ncbi:flagella cluster protein [Natrarchaeobius halalkaliphilus]|uniref:Flagella cluster protein n=1 Tax=Natrarchaeobius halalkaliphilus TaxID=1679091 RepID=A0A3N6LMK6_9EURY|nr:flagella cluster protein [Natrarchaeobius halalkaliphilus]
METDFDVHDHRHRMKLLRDDGATAAYDNRTQLQCPVCSNPFDRLLLIKTETISFPKNDGIPFCLVHRDDDIALFRH